MNPEHLVHFDLVVVLGLAAPVLVDLVVLDDLDVGRPVVAHPDQQSPLDLELVPAYPGRLHQVVQSFPLRRTVHSPERT